MSDISHGLLLDVLPDGVVIADGDGVTTQFNVAASVLLQVDPTAALGAHLSAVVALQDHDGRDWFACAQPYTGLSARRRLLESSWHAASGREVLVTASLERDRPGGKVTRVAVGLRDAKSRERVDMGRSDLVATVAHELRSPLTGVKGFTSTLLSKWERFTESQKLLMLRTVDADADRLTRLIAELLDVARIDAGRLSVRKEPVDLVDEVSRQLEPLAAAGGRSITMQATDQPRVWVDKDKFAQVVANLVENAVKHGAGDVTVSIREGAGRGAELIVDDEGSGIPEEIRPRIFTKFWKHGRRGGSGLGLYIVGGLVDAHGGDVHVESSPTGGARMRVTLPEGQPAILD
ncbi:MAG: PAS domain-containing sensor histidine kinase [Nocardioidaceae bacterium]|nr:PAS domain-containing sensor histidine kinase [Nocardioidaceae bacterium]